MPTYDYVCDGCGHAFDLFQQMTDPVKRKCPECGARKLKRLIGTGSGVLFKGDGFYQTDYRSESYRKKAEAEKKSAQPKTEATKDGKGGGSESRPPGAKKKTSAPSGTPKS